MNKEFFLQFENINFKSRLFQLAVLSFDSVQCTLNENGPQICTANGLVDKGNFIAEINHIHPGLWGKIMKFLMQILGNPNFDLELSSFLTEGLNQEFATNTGNTAFLNSAVTTKMTLEETISHNNGQTTSQISWSFYQEFQ